MNSTVIRDLELMVMRSKYFQELKGIRVHYIELARRKHVFCNVGIYIPFTTGEFFSYQRLGVDMYA